MTPDDRDLYHRINSPSSRWPLRFVILAIATVGIASIVYWPRA